MMTDINTTVTFQWKTWADELPDIGKYFFIIGITYGNEDYGIQSLACNPTMYTRQYTLIYKMDENNNFILNEKGLKQAYINEDSWHIEICSNISCDDEFGNWKPIYWIYVEDIMPEGWRISYEDYFKLIRKTYDSKISDDAVHKVCQIYYH